jgi:hypothetical protein
MFMIDAWLSSTRMVSEQFRRHALLSQIHRMRGEFGASEAHADPGEIRT